MSGLPTGTVTFLFTDLEGSTRLWEEHPDDMRVALARHDEILRKTVETHDGTIVKTTGDGLHAAFATADHALGAAVDAQLSLTSEVWPLPEPLRVRMGIHTGAAEERDGDYYGPAVNRAARVAAAAHGGQILVSHATEELGRDSLPPGAVLVDLGEHRLRDLARAERVFQLSAPRLRGDFPPPRSVDAFPGNLPVQLSSFIGRDADVAAIATVLRDARLVTLTGVGGVGKTRLATQVAAELLPYYPDGAWLCELAPATDSDALDQVIVAALGVTPREGVTLNGSILEYLANKELLIVLDNCEHLLDAAGALADAILRACAKVRIVATSREGLGVEGEHLRVVRSLPIAERDAAVGAIAATDTTRLFLDRAQAAQGDLAYDDAALRDVADICRRLDGIPLAIELAAARVVGMAPAEIATRLDERFRLLTGGRRTAVERHHTLRATVDWSYSLLGHPERLVFDRLGAFSGSFDTSAAEVVASDDELESWDVVDALSDLAAKSMIVREPRSDTTRFTLLETLRQYARERLDERDDPDVIRRLHAKHYVEVAGEIARGLRGAGELAARRRLADDLDNLRAAVTWALDSAAPDDRALGLRIIAHLALETNNDRTVGVGPWAIRAGDVARGADPAIECAVLAAAAEDLRGRGEFDAAHDLAREALTDLTLDSDGPVLAYLALSSVVATRGHPRAAMDEVLVAKSTIEASTGRTFRTALLAILASVWAGFAGELTQAESLAAEALATARGLDNPSLLASGLFARANALHRVDPEEALRDYEESAALTRSGASDGAFAGALGFVALLYHRRGDSATALDRVIECTEWTWELGDQSQVQNGLASGAVILLDLGECQLAATLLGGGTHTSIATNDIAENDPRWNLVDVRTRLRAELGDAAYDNAWSRGAEMPTEPFVAYAIAEMRRVRQRLSSETS
jgi:predicted ATPase/class 3 adenylate cyclase